MKSPLIFLLNCMYNYKTTYFKISLNEEISISSSDYKDQINSAKLHQSIIEIIEIINNNFSDIKLQLESLSATELEKLIDRYMYVRGGELFRELINLFTKYQKAKNRRFTSEHEEELNQHLNENAKDGWKLLSMNPIIKGYGNKEYHGSFGHDVTEGFVLVWEKTV